MLGTDVRGQVALNDRIDYRAVGLLIIFSLLMMACVPDKVTVKSSPQFQPALIKTMAILPFQALTTPQRTIAPASEFPEAPSEVRTQFVMPGEGALRGREGTRDPTKVSATAAQRITRMVYNALKHRPGVRILPLNQVADSIQVESTPDASVNMREKVKQVGAQLGADAVMVGLVRIYRERIGNKIAATPAVVGFETHVINPIDGRVLWTGEYYEEQKPLNQDALGFFERRGAFVTADVLAESGVRKMMKQFPVGLTPSVATAP